MSDRINRRQALAHGLGTAGLVAGAGLGGTFLPRAKAAPAGAPKRADRAPTAPVAIERCDSYQPRVFRRALDSALDRIGGIDELVRNRTVTIKLNMTGLSWDPVFGLPARETYQTQPDTVAALCAALVDAGVLRIVIVENYYWERPPEAILADSGWDIAAIRSAGDHRVRFEDTRNRGTFGSYSRFKVPWGGYIYPAFDLNARFEKTDVLISLAKLKQHACAGVTGSIKNFFGITPCSLYGNDAPNEDSLIHRTKMFHGGSKSVPAGVPAERDNDVPHDARFRVPHVTADVFGARPADLCIIDGVRSISGGEGHWSRGIKLVEPKLLLVGRNGVCTDAVATAVMGFDPQAPPRSFPFQGDNHLQLLADAGVGTNDPKRIEVVGVPLKEAVFPYAPNHAGRPG